MSYDDDEAAYGPLWAEVLNPTILEWVPGTHARLTPGGEWECTCPVCGEPVYEIDTAALVARRRFDLLAQVPPPLDVKITFGPCGHTAPTYELRRRTQ